MASQPVVYTGRSLQKSVLQPILAETRHVGHGGIARARVSSEQNLRQPQDGASDMRSRLAAINSNPKNNLLLEPEDARLTGGTRSLTRRLLGLNGLGSGKRKSPASATLVKTQVA